MAGLTSDDELLALDTRVPLGALQQGDPVVHLLGGVGVAVQHAVRSDDHKRVGPVPRGREGHRDSGSRTRGTLPHIPLVVAYRLETIYSKMDSSFLQRPLFYTEHGGG